MYPQECTFGRRNSYDLDERGWFWVTQRFQRRDNGLLSMRALQFAEKLQF
jgi:hypothetical protein